MLIPIGHDDLRGRRWPWVTIAIVALNLIAFLGTNWQLEHEAQEIHDVRVRILLIAASFPDVQMPAEVRQFVATFQRSNPKIFEKLGRGNHPPESVWEIQMLDWNPDQADEEMSGLSAQYQKLQDEALINKVAYFPYKPGALAILTANFLHAGWLHIIFNMWFLWLAGTIVEDTWGRVIYPIFYLVAGIVALLAHALVFPHSIVPVIGASGAVAGLMGAFLVLLPKTKIRLALVYSLGLVPRLWTFRAPTYAMLPLWLLTQVLWAMVDQSEGGVAYWSHIGGFVFGMAVAFGIKLSGLQKQVDLAIEDKISWKVDPRIDKAGDLLEQNKAAEAVEQLQAFVAEQPSSVEGHELLLQAYWKNQDMSGQRETLVTLCRLHLRARELDTAWRDFEEFHNLGGVNFPPTEWMELCRYLESQNNWERAAAEYENLAAAYAQDRVSLMALLSAARVNLRGLGKPEAASRLYRKADASPIPHLDLDSTIQLGLKQCTQKVPITQPLTRA